MLKEDHMSKSYHHLTYEQRCQIYTLKKRGDSVGEIAEAIGVDRSTVHRELKRNRGSKGYRYKQAQEKSKKRRHNASSQRKKMTPEMITLVESKLSEQWSPEQISGWLKKEENFGWVSHESIYQHIWEDKRRGRKLYKQLRHRGKKYNKRSKVRAGRGCIPNRRDIDERPKIVEEKSRLGDWELDTIIGKNHKGAVVSMVDRASKLTKLVKVPRRTAKKVEEALVQRLEPIRDHVHTLTADNGKEFANHETVSKILQADFFFAKPYHSWERGLNEHTNGLVRQYLPKSTSFDEVSDIQLNEIEKLLNNRPRKVLQFRTPIEVFNELSLGPVFVAPHS